jgi:hypothetical protein
VTIGAVVAVRLGGGAVVGDGGAAVFFAAVVTAPVAQPVGVPYP